MHKSDDDELLAGSESVDPDTGASSDAAASLPMPDASNLEEIRNRIRSATYLTREILLSNITRPGFVAKLYDLFNTAEDLEEIPALHVLFDVCIQVLVPSSPHCCVLIHLSFCWFWFFGRRSSCR
jgi:hypothetical protein